eukprot:4783547-Alexandrium_andersonii.AAC.1
MLRVRASFTRRLGIAERSVMRLCWRQDRALPAKRKRRGAILIREVRACLSPGGFPEVGS